MDYSYDILENFIRLCDDLAWGRPADENSLFSLTREGAAPPELVRLAEAFGMMVVKVEARDFHKDQLIEDLRRQNAALETARQQLAENNSRLSSSLQETYNIRRIVGQCPKMKSVTELALAIARRPINTLILGPTGSGKEVVAKTIHYHSPRRTGPFIAVNCTAIPESLFESEMFGIEKGVATGVSAKKGLIEEAHMGTLFLDELADMSLPNQAKLLRVLEEREVMRVGSAKPVPVDINVIAATNVNILKAVAEGKFREDLYYRINVAEIRLPALNERGDDILLLAQHFMDRHCNRMGRPRLLLSRTVRDCLLKYPWPGNVRELNNEMERAAALTVGDVVEAADLSPRVLSALPPDLREAALSAPSSGENSALPEEKLSLKNMPALPYNLEKAERILVQLALEKTEGNKSKAAELLGITREGLRKKIQRQEKAE